MEELPLEERKVPSRPTRNYLSGKIWLLFSLERLEISLAPFRQDESLRS